MPSVTKIGRMKEQTVPFFEMNKERRVHSFGMNRERRVHSSRMNKKGLELSLEGAGIVETLQWAIVIALFSIVIGLLIKFLWQ